MKLSTRTRYVVLAILELADHFGKGSLQTKVIAKTRIFRLNILSN
jgi:DNA-binding IscR family transcriptional regulator